MAAKKRGLGRGLDALLGGDLAPDADEAAAAGELHELALDDLHPGRYQPRTEIDTDALESLAQSIRTQGVLQPLVVRPDGSGYEIIAGERRWRAARIAGRETVPAVVREIGDEIAMAVALIENIQREDLNPLEEGAALRRLIRDCKMTHAQCAEAVGRSRAAVSNLLRLAELDDTVQDLLRQRRLEMGHARALLALPKEQQGPLAEKVVARGLTVRATEALVKAALEGSDTPRRERATRSPRLARLESDLSASLGTAVAIKPGRGGRGGRVVIEYGDAEGLDELVRRLK
ncbi:chromosome partitioning protein ParB [Salinisphaera sp. PC39]|uniref:ParB/RepB/Spo0J family partition protein n=1 Tax=Salinisphaera sp. PC39 TaxID=1304156 RepID=UPI00333EDED5